MYPVPDSFHVGGLSAKMFIDRLNYNDYNFRQYIFDSIQVWNWKKNP